MLGLSDMLSVAIGIVFVFLLLSLLTTWVQEFIASFMGMRSKHLANIMQNMLDPGIEKLEGVKLLEKKWSEGALKDEAAQLSENAMKAFYEHPVIQSLSKPNKLPSYIAPRDFTIALFDLLSKAGSEDPTAPEITLENIRIGISKIDNKPLRERLTALYDSAQVMEDKVESGIVAFRENIQSWFDSSMGRASGWYKRDAQRIGLIIGIIVAILFNADVINIGQSLWRDAALRDTVTASAVAYIETGEQARADEARQQLEGLGLPIGWSLRFPSQAPEAVEDPRDFPNTVEGWIWKLVGTLITGFAISQGSPIWFDLLGKLVNLRGSGSKPKTARAG